MVGVKDASVKDASVNGANTRNSRGRMRMMLSPAVHGLLVFFEFTNFSSKAPIAHG